ncbi:MAG: hypothetical protein QXJ27_06385 [Thermoplasmata archaeon]
MLQEKINDVDGIAWTYLGMVMFTLHRGDYQMCVECYLGMSNYWLGFKPWVNQAQSTGYHFPWNLAHFGNNLYGNNILFICGMRKLPLTNHISG